MTNYIFSAGSSVPAVENTRMPGILVLALHIFQWVQTNLLRACVLDRGFRRRRSISQQVHFFLPGKNAGSCSTPDISNFASYPYPHIKFNLMWGYPLSEKNHFSAFYCLELSALFTHLHCTRLFFL